MSYYSKQLGEQFAKSAGFGQLLSKGIGMAGRALAPMGSMGQNVMKGFGAGANAASHAVPPNFNPATMGGLFHSINNNLSRGVGGAIGGISRGMIGTNIPGIKQLGQAGMGMAGHVGHYAPTIWAGMSAANHLNKPYTNFLENQLGDYSDAYQQLLDKNNAHSGIIGNWLSQYL